MDQAKTLLESLLQSINYMPFVYNQLAMDEGNIFTIKYPFAEIPDNSLLFVLPIRNAQEVTDAVPFNKLKLLMPIVKYDPTDGTTSIDYSTTSPKVYNIYLEGVDGKLTKASLNTLVANRLAIFRFLKSDDDTVILINNPFYNNIQLNNLVVTQETTFREVPNVQTDPNDSTTKTPLITHAEFLELQNRISALENKFLYGDEEADVALADMPDGTIYVKVEED